MQIRKRAILLTVLFLLLLLSSILAIFYIRSSRSASFTAEIYQNGSLLHSIRLDEVTASYTMTISSDDGGCNVIEVRPGAIGILSADCPDLICVKQGFLTDSLLPITCLPHRLVIRIVPEEY